MLGSLGDKFYDCYDELQDVTFAAALQLLVTLFAVYFMSRPSLSQEQLKELYC